MKKFVVTTKIDGETVYLDKRGNYVANKPNAIRFSEFKAKKIARDCPWCKAVKL